MKVLYYLRHSDKEGQIIGRDGLDLVAKNVPTSFEKIVDGTLGSGVDAEARVETFTDFFHGLILRTAQTLLAAVTAKGMKGTVHPPIGEIGTDELFTEWKKTCKFGEEGKTNLEALQEGLSPKAFEEAKANAKKGVEIMFNQMTGDTGLAYGHSPVVECALMACGYNSVKLKLDSLEGAIFVQDEDGNIGIVEIIYIQR